MYLLPPHPPSPFRKGKLSNYHEKVINAGFNASGNNKCDAATVAMGRIATKSVMCQLYGIKGATARMTMPAMNKLAKSMEILNYCYVSTHWSKVQW